jgi:DNA polymerase
VFGEGPADARLMFIAEAPGEHEDAQGRPFVGPAGRLLDQALEQAGIPREGVYLTNIVKHRPWILQGRRKKNRPPRQSEIKACAPWLQGEMEIIRPEIVVCVGAPAAKVILGKEFRLTQQRGQWLSTPTIPYVLATIHPAYVLIQPEESFDFWRDTLFADLQQVAEKLAALPDQRAA